MANIGSVLEAFPRHQEVVPLQSTPFAKKVNFLRTSMTIRRLLTRGGLDAITIILTGTNGKGSTSRVLTMLLKNAGFNVGTISSPAMRSDMTDMISINGNNIGAETFEKYIESAKIEILRNLESMADVTHYMLICLAAYRYFKDRKVDYVVAETAVGGAFDPTVPIEPNFCAFTNICSDHVDVFGPELQGTARHKSRIIGRHSEVLLGDGMSDQIAETIEKYAKRHGANVTRGSSSVREDLPHCNDTIFAGSGIRIQDKSRSLPGYQRDNVALAGRIFERMRPIQGMPLDIDIGHVDGSFFPRFRFERARKNGIEYIFDCPKNSDAYERLRRSLGAQIANHRRIFVKGAVTDDNITEFERVFPDESIYYVSGYHPRAMNKEGFIPISELEIEQLARRHSASLVVVCGMFLTPIVHQRVFGND